MSPPELKLYQQAVLQAWNAVVITTADAAAGYPVHTANPSFCEMTGYTLDELRGRSLKRLQGPDTDPEILARLRDALREGRYFEGTTTNYRKDATPYVVRWNISPVRDEAGVLTHFVSVQKDLTEQVRADRQVRLLARALDACGDPVMLTDLRARIIFVNRAFTDITGYPADELIGRTPSMLRSGEHDAAFYARLREALSQGRPFRASFINRRRDGSTCHVEQSITPILDDQGRPSHYVSVSKDISERIQREHSLLEAATRDPLTGLHNRYYGEQRLEDARRASDDTGQPLTVILCDLDHFKQINDRFGHLVGDRALTRVASLLRQGVRGTDAVMRWGGEEFLILLEDRATEQAAELAERLRSHIAGHADAEVGTVTVSLGLATRAPRESMASLIARADAALYAAKHGGRNRVATSSTPPAA